MYFSHNFTVMEKRIKLKINDYRDNFKEPYKKKPYYLFIEYGSESFYFSNKEKAKRFLSRFKKESTLLFKELGIYINNTSSINVNLVNHCH